MLQQQELLTLARGFLQERKHKHLRNFIKAHHHVCETDEVRLQLLRLWEESLYLEFSESRQDSSTGSGSSPAALSSSMRYKLRKKFPCPVELDQELRVKNARLPKPVHDGLNSWLKENRENPYPNKREKESLASKLGITPQQVNRWFIQRRKMLRIRGRLYLGRNVKVDEDEDDEEDMEFEDVNNEYSSHKSFMNDGDSEQGPAPSRHESFAGTISMALRSTTSPAQPQDSVRPDPAHDVDDSRTMLGNVLTGRRSSVSPNMQHQFINQTLCSGGSVRVMDARDALDEGLFTLTPPPSISGDSNARSTPLDMLAFAEWAGNDNGEALDLSVKGNRYLLSKSSPVILEPVSPPWRSRPASSGTAASSPLPPAFYYTAKSGSNIYEIDNSICYSDEKVHSYEATVVPSPSPMDFAEQLAVHALLSLAHSR